MTTIVALGEEPPMPKGVITEPNEDFKRWVSDNGERIAQASTLPYWYKDNKQYIKSALKSENLQQNAPASKIDGALNAEYKGVVTGRDITSEFDVAGMVSADTFCSESFTYNAIKMQGFDSPAKLVSEEEFESLAKESGEVFYRTVSETTFEGKQISGKEFASKMYRADNLEPNGRGKRIYGDGIYVVSSAWDGDEICPLTEKLRDYARAGSSDYGRGDFDVSEMTWVRRPKLIEQEKLEEMFNSLDKSTREKFGDNKSTYAVALGYDAMLCHWINYITIYNRSIIAVKSK